MHLLFFFNDTATTEIYTLSLHDALPISALLLAGLYAAMSVGMTIIYGVMKIVNLAHAGFMMLGAVDDGDRKSTRLNSSHSSISYAVFCLKKKIKKVNTTSMIA